MPEIVQCQELILLMAGYAETQIYRYIVKNIFSDGHPLDSNDGLVIMNGHEEQMTALLLTLILNVKEEGRGICSENDIMDVYLVVSRDNMLRISNETKCEDDMMSCLEREPVNEERGITVWTMNCYIKRMKVAFIREQINRVTSKEMLPEVIAYAKKLLSDGFCVKMRIVISSRYTISFCSKKDLLSQWTTYAQKS